MAFKRPRASSPSGAQKRSRAVGAPSKNIKLGTELPPEDDNDDGSFVPVWKQTVTDERGRRRLHGAFTGGFSAGYFNTVGSKEGWTPKTFVSSRANRHKEQANASTQRPEDFMDEEDLAQAAESRQLETAHSFAGIGDSTSTSTNDAFFGLFMTEEDTMGVKIVQKMGWRRDQGIGRKLRRPAHLGDLEDAPKDEQSKHFFAPKDSRAMPIIRQDSRKGLGFQSEGRLSKEKQELDEEEPSFNLPFLEKKKPAVLQKPGFKKSSFGVGVLNDTGSDDEDPYELGPKISFNKTTKKDKKVKKPSKFSKTSGDKHLFVSKKGASAVISSVSLQSRDGRPPLRGFTLAIRITTQPSRMKYPPAKIPPGWKSSKSATQNTDTSPLQSVADAARSSTLDAQARASLLGETPLSGKSVFDFISKETRDRIAALTGRTDLPQGQGQSAPEGHKPEGQKDLWSFVPVLDKSVAAGALAKGATGWMPYAEDLSKRARYIAFLELKAGLKHALPSRAPGLSVSDWVNEMKEFAQAADVFKPTSGIMASRFTSSSASTPQSTNANGSTPTLLRTPTTTPSDPADQAAKLGMYGPMTRSLLPFHPTRLLCKRFNVRPPPDVPLSADADERVETRAQEPVSKGELDRMMREVLTRGAGMQRPSWMNKPRDSGVEAVATPELVGHAVVDVESNEALARERAPEDVFRDIFGDDDDEG